MDKKKKVRVYNGQTEKKSEQRLKYDNCKMANE